MNRDEVLASYRPIRAAIQRILRAAIEALSRADLTRAAKHLQLWSEEQLEAGEIADMLCDVALFEPNQRGRRAYDRFLSDKAERLEPADRDLAHRMASAFFSVFRLAGRHEAAGVRVEDLLDGRRRLWIMDEGLEVSAPEGLAFGMRVFDAGPFHAGFGIVVPADESLTHVCIEARRRGVRLPLRHSLAATLYADAIAADAVLDVADEDLMEMLVELLPEKALSRLTKRQQEGDVAPTSSRPKHARRRPGRKREA